MLTTDIRRRDPNLAIIGTTYVALPLLDNNALLWLTILQEFQEKTHEDICLCKSMKNQLNYNRTNAGQPNFNVID